MSMRIPELLDDRRVRMREEDEEGIRVLTEFAGAEAKTALETTLAGACRAILTGPRNPQEEAARERHAVIAKALLEFNSAPSRERERLARVMEAISHQTRAELRDSLLTNIRVKHGVHKSPTMQLPRLKRNNTPRRMGQQPKSPLAAPSSPLGMPDTTATTALQRPPSSTSAPSSERPSSPLAPSPGSFPAEAQQTADPSIVCRICESPVKSSLLESHTKFCEEKNRCDLMLIGADRKLFETLQALEEITLTSAHARCTQPMVDCAEDAFENEIAKLEELSETVSKLPRNCTMQKELTDALAEVVNEKVAVLKHLNAIYTAAPPELDLKSTPRFLRESRSPSSSSPASEPSDHSGTPSPVGTFTVSTLDDTPGRIAPLVLDGSPRDSGPAHLRHRSQQNLQAIQSLQHPGLSIDDFELIKLLAQGGFGKGFRQTHTPPRPRNLFDSQTNDNPVFLARKKATGDVFAIKVLSKRAHARKNSTRNLLMERDVLAETQRNPFIDSMYLVQEYLPGGDLLTLVHNLGSLEEDMAKFYIAETILAVEYLHSKGIVHRDLKPDNLLIDGHGHVKLTDFGLSKKGLLKKQVRGLSVPMSCCEFCENQHKKTPTTSPATAALQDVEEVSPRPGCPGCSCSNVGGTTAVSPTPESVASTKVGTPDYIAPEVLMGLPHGAEVDWWALGIVLYELICGVPPFAGGSVHEIFDNILRNRLTWPPGISDDAKDLISRLLEISPEKRLGYGGAEEIKQHPFFADVRWDTLRDGPPPFTPELTSDQDTSFFDGRSDIKPIKITPPPTTPPAMRRKEEPVDEYLFVDFKNLAEKTLSTLRGGQPSKDK